MVFKFENHYHVVQTQFMQLIQGNPRNRTPLLYFTDLRPYSLKRDNFDSHYNHDPKFSTQKSLLNCDNSINWNCNIASTEFLICKCIKIMLYNFGVCDNWRVVLSFEIGPFHNKY